MRHKCRTALLALVAVFAMSAVASASALASGSSPSAITKPATSISETKATLNGTVNPRGATTKYYFEYGPTTSYGKKTSEISVGSGEKALEESQTIELTPGSVYHFRIVAINENGRDAGEGEFFFAPLKPGLPEFAPEGGKFPVTLEYAAEKGSGDLSGSGGSGPKCDGVTVKGELTGAKTASLSLELRDCKSAGEECELGEHGAAVEYYSGSASPVYINKPKKEVGLMFVQNKIRGESCPAITTIQGALVIPITPINTKTSKPTFSIEGNGLGVQDFSSYENEKGEVLKTNLEANFGSGPTKVALEMGEFSLTANKAFTVSG